MALEDYLFIQERLGKNNLPFKMYKIRTMYPNSSLEKILDVNNLGRYGKIENDDRITPLGRFLRKYWLDELPQILNMLRGEMSLIGVRPLPRECFDRLPEDIQKKRARYKPGLISQLYADNITDWESRLESERVYLNKKEVHPIITDIVYFFKIAYNIIFKSARGL